MSTFLLFVALALALAVVVVVAEAITAACACVCRSLAAVCRDKEGIKYQNHKVVTALRLMTAGLPFVVAVISLAVMQWYHINEVRGAVLL
jgi:hypothetical protein